MNGQKKEVNWTEFNSAEQVSSSAHFFACSSRLTWIRPSWLIIFFKTLT